MQSLKNYAPKIIQESAGTLDLLIDEVQVSFLEYKYPMLEDLLSFDGVMMASVVDIGCMKVSAISSRGTKKDYVDLYFILQKLTLEDLLDAFSKKYKGIEYSKSHILKSLVYFDDAEADPDPDYLISTKWSEIKGYITEVTKGLSNGFGL